MGMVSFRLNEVEEAGLRGRLGLSAGAKLGSACKRALLEGVEVEAPAVSRGGMSDREQIELGKKFLARSHAGGKLSAAEAALAARVPFRERPGFVVRPPLSGRGEG